MPQQPVISEPIHNGNSRYQLSMGSIYGVGVGAGYDATKTSGRRRNPVNQVAAEDRRLDTNNRKTLIATTRDARRNFAVLRWMINKHLDFVVSHNFQAQTNDDDFNRRLERFVEVASRKEFFDSTQRHPRRRWMRMAEAARTIDGDFLGVKMFGGSLAGIEGDRIRDNPEANKETETWIHGVRVNSRGVPDRYAIHKRQGSQFEYERTVRADRAIFFGYFDRFDQYRGISPVAAGLNSLRDLYEGFDYALAKAKVDQLFALALTRNSEYGIGGSGETDDNDPGGERQVNFEKGPQLLDLDIGEDAKFLSNNTPAADTANFWQTITAVVLKALDIPYSFFNESFTNFFGSRSALILYIKSVQNKRLDVQEFLNEWLCWRLEIGQIRGEIQLPEGFVCDPVNWKWIPDGVAWWNPAQEIGAWLAAIEGGLATRTEFRMFFYGDDWKEDVVDKLAEEQAYLDQQGVNVSSTKTLITLGGSDGQE